jgi:hypothetical protein
MSTPAKKLEIPDHLKVFANIDAAETWSEEHDPEGVAFEYDVIENGITLKRARSRDRNKRVPTSAV